MDDIIDNPPKNNPVFDGSFLTCDVLCTQRQKARLVLQNLIHFVHKKHKTSVHYCIFVFHFTNAAA